MHIRALITSRKLCVDADYMCVCGVTCAVWCVHVFFFLLLVLFFLHVHAPPEDPSEREEVNERR